MAVHERFGEDLRSLDLGGGPGRCDDGEPPLAEVLFDSQEERTLGADDGEIDPASEAKCASFTTSEHRWD